MYLVNVGFEWPLSAKQPLAPLFFLKADQDAVHGPVRLGAEAVMAR